MALQAIVRNRALLVAKHEFGHWLMAARLGFKPGDIEIKITHHGQGHSGGASITLDEETKSIEAIQFYIRRRIAVLFAGSFAESLSPEGKVNPEYAVDQLQGKAVEQKMISVKFANCVACCGSLPTWKVLRSASFSVSSEISCGRLKA